MDDESKTHLEILKKYIEGAWGSIHLIQKEIVPDEVYIELYWIKPSEKNNFNILVTGGMSLLPMNTPQNEEILKYSELAICLPPTWKVDSVKEEDNWPLRLLKDLARYPHRNNKFMTLGNSIPHFEESFAKNTKLNTSLIWGSRSLENLFDIQINGKKVNILFVIPLYREEDDFRIEHGRDSSVASEGTLTLLNLFEEKGITPDIVDPQRPRVV